MNQKPGPMRSWRMLLGCNFRVNLTKKTKAKAAITEPTQLLQGEAPRPIESFES